MPLDRDSYLAALMREGLALADAAERAGLDATVPTCPGWAVTDLVWHVGEVHHFWRSAVEERWDRPSTYVEPDRPSDDDLVEWYRRGLMRTVGVLQDADQADRVWTWARRGGDVAWVVRRVAQETAVHRWDADRQSIDAALAGDGIDEFLEHFTGRVGDGATPLGGTVHLHVTDDGVEGEWLIAEATPGGRLDVRRQHAKGDVAVRGAASDLLLLLWRRVKLDRDAHLFDVYGDVEVARRLLIRTDLG